MLGEFEASSPAANPAPPPAPVIGPDAPRPQMATLADKKVIDAQPLDALAPFNTSIALLEARAKSHGEKAAASFQLKGDASCPLSSMTYAELLAEVRRLANALHAAGVKPGETVGVLMPNMPETLVAMFAGHAIGAVSPISPLLEPEIIASILREAGATALVTLAPMPKTDVAAKAAAAAALAPKIKAIVEVDLVRYLSGPLRYIAPLLRPKRVTGHSAEIVSYHKATRAAPADRFTFEHSITPDTISAYFHTGGTTGTPKLAQHHQRGIVANPLLSQHMLFRQDDVILCALPLFHVFASYPMALCSVAAAAHFVMITPQGFRGDGVMDNFWKLIERHKATFFAAVPTAISALDQRPVDADVSSLRYMLSGSAPLPQALFRRFEKNTGVKILEGYGMTEATCVTSCNPPDGERRIGSVGLPLPHVAVKILGFDGDGQMTGEMPTDEIGEICFRSACVFAGYKDESKNADVFYTDEGGERWLRTGDLGRVDAEGYIWITGRAKDLIIRGGHNIDPGLIEECLAAHDAVAFVGAIGQPDAYSGELPCAYVELKDGASATPEELKSFAAERIMERAAKPTCVEVLDELPKTAVGKIFKPALRKQAIARVYAETLRDKGMLARVTVADDDTLGMVAVVTAEGDPLDEAAVAAALNGFPRPWRMG